MVSSQTVDLATLLRGYDEAFDRFKTAREAARQDGDPTKMYIALFEVLNWAVVIDDLLRKKKLGDRWYTQVEKRKDQGLVVLGFRCARNRVHHQWANAVRLDNQPKLFRDWCWCPLDELPPAEEARPAQERAYTQKLASRALRFTFRDLHSLFNAAEKMVCKGQL
jgi:hypothetical protein